MAETSTKIDDWQLLDVFDHDHDHDHASNSPNQHNNPLCLLHIGDDNIRLILKHLHSISPPSVLNLANTSRYFYSFGHAELFRSLTLEVKGMGQKYATFNKMAMDLFDVNGKVYFLGEFETLRMTG